MGCGHIYTHEVLLLPGKKSISASALTKAQAIPDKAIYEDDLEGA